LVVVLRRSIVIFGAASVVTIIEVVRRLL